MGAACVGNRGRGTYPLVIRHVRHGRIFGRCHGQRAAAQDTLGRDVRPRHRHCVCAELGAGTTVSPYPALAWLVLEHPARLWHVDHSLSTHRGATLQQALSIDFTQALNQLGINIVVLTYARAAVAVFLGAILAMTNVESEMVEQPALGPKRRVVLLDNLLNRIAPVVTREEKTLELPENVDIAKLPTVKLPPVAVPEPTQLLSQEQATAEVRSVVEQPQSTAQVPAQLLASNKQQTVRTETMPEERFAKVRELNLDSLGAAERVTRIVALFPDVPDRELGRLCGVSAATAKKYRNTVHAMANLPVEG